MFEHYIMQDGKKLRLGYTTGTCATIASAAAVRMLLGGETVVSSGVITPKGLEVYADVLDAVFDENSASCAVEKDGGDDIDATNGILVYSKAEKIGEGIVITGGKGVGKVTKPGLDQPVGEYAINHVPREMITKYVSEVMKEFGYEGGIKITVSIPKGEEVAVKTFNPNLGIVGGISVLGTSGIVEPKSLEALKKSIFVEMNVIKASGADSLIVTPGNYGENFIGSYPSLASFETIKCANFIADTIRHAVELDFKRILCVGHIGKFVKLAGGISNTHSMYADCRNEIFAANAALCGGDIKTVERIMDAATTDECVAAIRECGIERAVMDRIISAAQKHVKRWASDDVEIGILIYSNVYGVLGMSPEAEKIIEKN